MRLSYDPEPDDATILVFGTSVGPNPFYDIAPPAAIYPGMVNDIKRMKAMREGQRRRLRLRDAMDSRN